MRFLSFIFGVFVLVVTPQFAFADHDDAVAYVKSFSGAPVVVRHGGDVFEPLSSEALIHVGDVVNTDKGDIVHLVFNDDTEITVAGKGGHFKVKEYLFNKDKPAENKARYKVLGASLKYVGGQISKLSQKQNTDIELDFGTIGIRGTTLYRAMGMYDDCWIYLEDGKVDVYNDAGKVTLKPGDGTRLTSQKFKPQGVRPWAKPEIKWIKSTLTNRVLPAPRKW